MQFVVEVGSNAEQIVGPDVHHQEFSFFAKSETILAGRKFRSFDVELHFCDQEALILLRYIGRIAGGVDHARQYHFAVSGTEIPPNLRICTGAL